MKIYLHITICIVSVVTLGLILLINLHPYWKKITYSRYSDVDFESINEESLVSQTYDTIGLWSECYLFQTNKKSKLKCMLSYSRTDFDVLFSRTLSVCILISQVLIVTGQALNISIFSFTEKMRFKPSQIKTYTIFSAVETIFMVSILGVFGFFNFKKIVMKENRIRSELDVIKTHIDTTWIWAVMTSFILAAQTYLLYVRYHRIISRLEKHLEDTKPSEEKCPLPRSSVDNVLEN